MKLRTFEYAIWGGKDKKGQITGTIQATEIRSTLFKGTIEAEGKAYQGTILIIPKENLIYIREVKAEGEK